MDSVEQEPENIMDTLSAYDDDAKSLFAGGLDDDGDLGMGDVEQPIAIANHKTPLSRQAWRGLGVCTIPSDIHGAIVKNKSAKGCDRHKRTDRRDALGRWLESSGLACLPGTACPPLLGQALFSEHEDVMKRAELFRECAISATERMNLQDALLSVSEWVEIYFAWRAKLPDEGDNHLIQLAVAGSADCIISHNCRHLSRAELRFPGIQIFSPIQILEALR